MLYPNIDEKILQALMQVFTLELQTIPLSLGDPLALRTLKQSDLQDDPTLTAPYLVFRPLDGMGEQIRLPDRHEQEMYGCAEIGGPIRYLFQYEAKFGTPLAATREIARASISTLMARIMSTLMHHFDLSDILVPGYPLMSDDQTQIIEGANDRLVAKGGPRIYGGEQTFYGEGKLQWHYPVSWLIPHAIM